ncbi:MAG: hypothetical protein P4M09_30490 [Devosia sp.]|nr:hypothetical protein [Devosia sp.]
MTDKARARLDRQFAWIGRRFPSSRPLIGWIRRPAAWLIRVPLSIILIAGGILSFLPVLGIWMLPLGLLLLAIDLPILERPVGNVIVRLRRLFATLRRKRQRRAAA